MYTQLLISSNLLKSSFLCSLNKCLYQMTCNDQLISLFMYCLLINSIKIFRKGIQNIDRVFVQLHDVLICIVDSTFNTIIIKVYVNINNHPNWQKIA